LTERRKKVFQIGFNKCGTRTLHEYFKKNGKSSVHWDKGRLARQIFYNLRDGHPLLSGYERYDVFCDMESISRDFAFEAFKLFPLLSEQYPDAVFILNTRGRDNWIRSRLHHAKGVYVDRWKTLLKISSDDSLIAFWEREWTSHHQRVRDYFAARTFRFFEFDIEQDGPSVISENIPEFAMDERLYVTSGKTNYDISVAALAT
jgi:hypothetical protein